MKHCRSRFALLTGLVAVSLTLGLSPAQADDAWRAERVLDRLGYGPRPGDLQQVEQMGVNRYIDQQLHPETLQEPDALKAELASLDTIGKSPDELYREFAPPLRHKGEEPKAFDAARKQARQRAREILRQATEEHLARALESPRQLQEVMTAFWFNHFNVYAGKGLDSYWIGAYEDQAIRPYALGHFRDLLGAVAKHPAMLFYLDNWQNSAPNPRVKRGQFKGINENFARELMELHTLGVDGGYTQKDVIALAHLLTGWGFERRPVITPGGFAFFFDPKRHDNSDQVLLGKTISGQGEQAGETALDMLASSPATAHHLSYELAQYFVSDDPPPRLVDALANTYLQSDGDIRAVLAALFHNPEFWSREDEKFKTPQQYVLSALRATETQVENYGLVQRQFVQLGQPLFGMLTPNGYKNTQEAWLSPDAMARRMSFSVALASGRMPFAKGSGEPAKPGAIAAVLGDPFSTTTRAAIAKAPPRLRAALMLGSPEFMHR
ncbi:MAG TPA: DUF1800 domain-containing protein [Oscillatoriaceae cyanobacterium]